ncbi:hypothetical protein SDJN03_14328, partial [Cucurbita argyrosperma subsp. sororia]
MAKALASFAKMAVAFLFLFALMLSMNGNLRYFSLSLRYFFEMDGSSGWWRQRCARGGARRGQGGAGTRAIAIDNARIGKVPNKELAMPNFLEGLVFATSTVEDLMIIFISSPF